MTNNVFRPGATTKLRISSRPTQTEPLPGGTYRVVGATSCFLGISATETNATTFPLYAGQPELLSIRDGERLTVFIAHQSGDEPEYGRSSQTFGHLYVTPVETEPTACSE
jgi:hypothetical protein